LALLQCSYGTCRELVSVRLQVHALCSEGFWSWWREIVVHKLRSMTTKVQYSLTKEGISWLYI
jgi:hypothetical protein